MNVPYSGPILGNVDKMPMPPPATITNYKPLMGRRRRFGRSTCFLCRCPLRTKNRSDEHIFPKWLQKRFNLRDLRLELLNRSLISYKQLTIPCCKRCNNEHLSRIEVQMRDAVLNGPRSVSRLDPIIPYLWLSKIYYGLLYCEHFLSSDRKKPFSPIVPREALENLDLHHYYLQGAKHPIQFPLGLPGSVFAFGTSKPDRIEEQFDFLDLHHKRGIGIRMGSVGLICIFQDGGLIRKFHDSLRRPYYRRNTLHPVQFRQAAAEVFYKAHLLRTRVGFQLIEDDHKIMVLPQHSSQVLFNDWILEDFCRMLAHFLDQRLEDIYAGDAKYASTIRTPDGKFITINPNHRVVFGGAGTPNSEAPAMSNA
jgi:hypothetical protein